MIQGMLSNINSKYYCLMYVVCMYVIGMVLIKLCRTQNKVCMYIYIYYAYPSMRETLSAESSLIG